MFNFAGFSVSDSETLLIIDQNNTKIRVSDIKKNKIRDSWAPLKMYLLNFLENFQCSLATIDPFQGEIN